MSREEARKRSNIELSDLSEVNDELIADDAQDGGECEKLKDKVVVTYPNNVRETLWLLTKFILPLIITQMVPDIAEQVLNRGITTLADDDMVQLLAAFGLANYVTRFLSSGSLEVRHIGIVLVRSKHDHKKAALFCLSVGLVLMTLQLAVSLSPAGMWLIRDIHQQPVDVSELTCKLLAYLAPIPLIEAVAYYFEGGLIGHKLTHYAGIAKFSDFGLQVLFTIVLLFLPTRTDPILVPLFALYAGYIGRLMLCSGFWLVLIRRQLPQKHDVEQPLTILRAFKFWIPLLIVRLVQTMSRPLINLTVSRTLAARDGKEEAKKAIAVLTAVYPTGRILFSWLNDMRAVVPAFHRSTSTHRKIPLKTLFFYTVFCTCIVLTLHSLLFIIPGPGYFIMHVIVGLTPELANLSLDPLKIFSVLCLCVGFRAYFSGILIMKKMTIFLTPSAIARFIGLLIMLPTISRIRMPGAVLGITCLFLSFFIEAMFVGFAHLWLKFKPNFSLNGCTRKPNEEDNSEKEISS